MFGIASAPARVGAASFFLCQSLTAKRKNASDDPRDHVLVELPPGCVPNDEAGELLEFQVGVVLRRLAASSGEVQNAKGTQPLLSLLMS